MAVEPATEVVEGDPGGQAGLEAAEGVGSLSVEAERQQEGVVDGLDDLPEPAVPAAQGRGPGLAGGRPGRADDLRPIVGPPVAVEVGPDEAAVGHVRPAGRAA